VRQPFVEIGKGFLETRLKDLQAKGPDAVREEFEKSQSAAREMKAQTNIIGEPAIQDAMVAKNYAKMIQKH
jgi:hypothetical protein